MADKINLTFAKSSKYGNKTFEFSMTNHLLVRSASGAQTACNKISEWIIDNAEAILWMNSPLWHITNGFRFVLIEPTNPLWYLLDGESKKKLFNWLIFQNHPKRDSKLKVTHFGPFGNEKNKKYKENFDKLKEKFFEKLAEKLAILNNIMATEEEKKRAKESFQTHIDNHYIKVIRSLHSEIDIFKAIMIDTIKFIYGTAQAGVVLTTKLGVALAPTALKIGCKILVKETMVVISKQLAKEIVKITSKIAAKEAGAIAGKKIPVVGLVFGLGLGAFRLCHGDVGGACLEVASGAVSTIPGGGTAASFAIDGLLAVKDINEALEKLKFHQSRLLQASSSLEELIEKVNILKEEQDLVHNVFFRGGFNYENRGQEFIEAFQHLVNATVSA